MATLRCVILVLIKRRQNFFSFNQVVIKIQIFFFEVNQLLIKHDPIFCFFNQYYKPWAKLLILPWTRPILGREDSPLRRPGRPSAGRLAANASLLCYGARFTCWGRGSPSKAPVVNRLSGPALLRMLNVSLPPTAKLRAPHA